MKMSDCIHCKEFPCKDVLTDHFTAPDVVVDPHSIKMIMISEGPSVHPNENFYEPNSHEYMQATLQIFRDAGLDISNMNEIIHKGVYITTAIKCPKEGLSISTETVKNCSYILEDELSVFTNIKVILLNGDVAIKAMNHIRKRQDGVRIIPAGSTYKIRKAKYEYRGIRYLPSYILTGKNLLIEKSKRKMITEDIREVLKLIK